jgi:hypothetical protein
MDASAGPCDPRILPAFIRLVTQAMADALPFAVTIE